MGLKNVYGFTDDGKKVKIAEYIELLPVGGIIFYIDDTSTAVVKFYDADKNELVSVAVGDAPAYYDVVTADPNGKDKYYIFDNTLRKNFKWGYYTTTGATSGDIGGGKSNTEAVLHIEDTSGATNTMWDWLRDANTNKLNGCEDWFIASRSEMNAFRDFARSSGSSLIDTSGNNISSWLGPEIWSSSEVSSLNSMYMSGNPSGWFRGNKAGDRCFFVIRAF